MRTTPVASLMALAFTAVLPSIGTSQQVEFVEAYNKRHAGTKPVVGDTLDEVKLFDAEGNPFSTRDMRGKHTVLVFGCLT